MSWQLASFLVIGVVLLGGFAWYERSRPPSQVVALVAALAALAIAGRIAFAAIPNVKPTTDIVIFAGYALGAAPGFAVGALAGLVSNFWFGQGPWTPWQMAGWGLCGILGAALALGGRNVGRLTLAAVCGVAGVAYGALLNFSLMATYGGDLSLQHFLALEGRAVPFDAAHAVGNVTLALIAGPAMVRMLVRFRERFEWKRADRVDRAPTVGSGLSPGLGGVAAALLIVAALSTVVPPARAGGSGADRAAHWLVSVQNTDGGFGSSPGNDSSAAMTGWAMLGLEAAGRNPFDVSRGGHTPLDFLRSNQEEISSTGDLARTILALEGAGANPRSFAGRDLVAELAKRRRDNGSFENWPNDTAFSIIALRQAGATGGLDKSFDWLHKVQNHDGGWGDVPGSPSTADGTGAVMQAMPDTDAARHGLAYLRKAQRPGGGLPLGGTGPVNSQSTAWAVQGIRAVGADPGSIRQGGDSLMDYLASRQESDGHYRYSASSNQTPIWVTGQVLVATAGKSFPIPPPPRVRQAPTSKAGIPSSTSNSAASPGPSAVSSGSDGDGGPGAPPKRFAPQRPPAPGTAATTSPAGGLEGEGSDPTQSGALASKTSNTNPWPAIGIGLAVAGLALGSVWWLARRYDW
jgi:prenyltransferase beta subunit